MSLRRKHSEIWTHFNEMGNRQAKCNYCNIVLSIKSQSNLGRHLKSKHPTIMPHFVCKLESDWAGDNAEEQGITFNKKSKSAESMMVIWREGEVNYLIDMIKSNGYVWDPSLPDYTKKQKKTTFFKNVAKKLNANFSPRKSFTKTDCIRKWTNLQTYFFGGFPNFEENMPEGWKYSSKLNFLIGARAPNASPNTLNNSEHFVFDTGASFSDSNQESEMELCESKLFPDAATENLQDITSTQSHANLDNSYESLPEVLNAKLKTELAETSGNFLLDHVANNVNKLSDTITNQMKNEKENRSYYFSKYVGQRLEHLDADLNLVAREKISEILFMYEREQLKRQ